MRQLTCAEIAEQDLMARYVAGRLSDDDVEALESHYLTCERCYAELRLAVAIRDTLPEVMAIETPRPPVVELDTDANRGAARRMGRTGTRVPRRVTVGAAVALAAAAVLTLIVARPFDVTTPAPAAIHRDDRPDSASLPLPQAPVGMVAAASEFRWFPVTGADQYRVTLYDADGEVVWETETPGTRVAPPAEIRFEPGASYLWEVAARVDWNRWVRSSMARFEVRQH